MKNLLRSLSVILSFTVAVSSFAQKDNVGIGTSKPDQSAVLDLSSSNKGLLMPRMSLQQKTTIQSPAVGLVVYQTDFLSGFYYYDGKDWKSMSSVGQNSIAGTDGDWTIGGNGASPSAATVADVIGTLTNNPIAFKVNGTKSGYIDNSAREQFFLGYNSGSASYLPSMGTGFWNLGIGTSSLYTNTNGNYNTGIGAQTLRFATGDGNTAVGALSLFNLRSGIYNMALGSGSLRDAVSSAANTAVGTNSLITSLGSGNVALGYQTAINKTGDRNVYIGFFAGANGTDVTSPVVNISESDKLYIANSSTTTPLIKGDFANNSLRFHLGATAPTPTTGYLAIGDFATAAGTTGGAGGLGIPAMATASDKYRLIVQDGILTERLKVALRNSTEWADYVFDKSYKLMPLEKVEAFVKANKHLPNVPSAEEMAATGIDMQKTSTKFMEKIEELTLYMIEMNKEIKALKAENERLKKK